MFAGEARSVSRTFALESEVSSHTGRGKGLWENSRWGGGFFGEGARYLGWAVVMDASTITPVF